MNNKSRRRFGIERDREKGWRLVRAVGAKFVWRPLGDARVTTLLLGASRTGEFRTAVVGGGGSGERGGGRLRVRPKRSQSPNGRTTTHFEVYVTVFVHVECPKHVVAEFFGVAARKEHFVHVHEFGRR